MAAASQSEIDAAKRWGVKDIYLCSSCQVFINDGTEKAWTGRFDAPEGRYRYSCRVCRQNFCETCHDSLPATGGRCGPLPATHQFDIVPPVKSKIEAHRRHIAAATEDAANPWGAFQGSVSGQSMKRLAQRTGYKF
jgi:hypothetical protein